MASTAGTGSSTKSKTAKAAPAKTTTTRQARASTQAKSTTTATKSATAAPRKSTSAVRPVDPEQRRHYIEVAAYYIAERRGFIDGGETRDWLAAEAEIDRLLREKKLNA